MEALTAPAPTGAAEVHPPGPRPEPERKRSRKPAPANLAVQRAVRLLRLQPRQRELLARLLGLRSYVDRSEADAVRLVSAASEAGQLGKVLGELTAISACQDPLEAGVLATELALDKAKLSSAWAALGGDGPVPSSKPGLALAQAVRRAEPSVWSDIKALGGALA